MINLEPIHPRIQKRLFEKSKALSKESPYPDETGEVLTQSDMMTRTTFIKMVSEQLQPIILMGGELMNDTTINFDGDIVDTFRNANGYQDIYGPRFFKKSFSEDFDLEESEGFFENDKSRPIPGIKSIDVSFKGGTKSSREATINWTCWSFEEITRLTPHFLSHGSTVLLEWGWVYNTKSLLDLPTFVDPVTGINREAYADYTEEIFRGKGDFDMMVGVVKNFDYTTREDGAFDCTTILSSVGVNLFQSPIPNDTLMDAGEIFKIDSQEDTNKVISKISKALTKDKDLISFDLNFSLKSFLKIFDRYLSERVASPIVKKTNKKASSRFPYYAFRYEPNKYVWFGDIKGVENPLASGLKYNYTGFKDAWVRWGWFEDNILSKFISMVGGKDNKNIITQLRSIEFVNNKFESVRIKSSKFLETIDLDHYILPGKYSPQGPSEFNTSGGYTAQLEGDDKYHQVLSSIVNDKKNFKQFDVPNNSKFGYFRNMLVNIKVILEAFGVNQSGVESMSISDAMSSLFDGLNTPIDLWDFELKQDEIDSDRIKIVDDQVTAVDFTKPISTQRSVYDGTNFLNIGIFYFPVWQTNSIVKTQNITAKIPSALQLSAMYGANVDQISVKGEPGGFGEKEGIIAGGLGNDKPDKHKFGAEFAYKKLLDIGNSDGFANQKLTENGGKQHNVVDFLTRNSEQMKKDLSDERKKREKELKGLGYLGSQDSGFDDSQPVPLLSFLGDVDKVEAYFSTVTPEQVDGIEELYGKKYIDKKMKPKFVESVNYMVTSNQYETKYTEKNKSYIIPLEMELEIDGTGGIYPGNSYHSTYLPKIYQEKTVFQIFDVNHTIDSSGWKTTLSGKMRSTIGQVYDKISDERKLSDIIKNYDKLKGSKREKAGDSLKFGDDGFVSDTAPSSTAAYVPGAGATGEVGGDIPEGDVVQIDDFIPTNEISEEDQADIDNRAETFGVPIFTGDNGG